MGGPFSVIQRCYFVISTPLLNKTHDVFRLFSPYIHYSTLIIRKTLRIISREQLERKEEEEARVPERSSFCLRVHLFRGM